MKLPMSETEINNTVINALGADAVFAVIDLCRTMNYPGTLGLLLWAVRLEGKPAQEAVKTLHDQVKVGLFITTETGPALKNVIKVAAALRRLAHIARNSSDFDQTHIPGESYLDILVEIGNEQRRVSLIHELVATPWGADNLSTASALTTG